MAFDTHRNLAISTVAVAPSPPDSGLSLTVGAGHGGRFDPPPFQVTIHAAGGPPTPLTAEICRCTGIVGDVLTLLRAQEGSSARTIRVGDLIYLSITAKALTDIEAAITTTPPVAHHLTHEDGGSDEVTLAQSQVTGLTTALGGKVDTTDPRLTNARTPTAHAPTHSSGQSDPVTVTALAGYPGGTANFLRADGTFAAPPTGGIPAAHHLTHETGGSDQVVNLSAAVLTSGTLPDARLSANVQLKPIAAADLPAHAARHQPGGADPMTVDAAAATGSLRTIGTGPLQATAGNDARLTNARTPTAHATTHGSGGGNPVTVTALAGYPGGTANFLRADGTFALPPGGSGVAAHHATHEVGGSDQITGAMAITTLAVGTNPATSGVLRLPNSGLITARNAGGTADLTVASTAGDAVVFGANVVGGVYVVVGDTLLLRSDAYGLQDRLGTNLYGWDANQFYPFGSKSLGLPANRWTTGYFGALDTTGNVTVGGNASVTGTGGNVACKNQANVFTQTQTVNATLLTSTAQAGLYFQDTASLSTQRAWGLMAEAQVCYLNTYGDNWAGVQARPLTIQRSGNVIAGGGVFDHARGTAMGDWTDGLGHMSGAGWTGTYYYSRTGHSLALVIHGSNTLGAPAASITLSLPFPPVVSYTAPCMYFVGVNWLPGSMAISAGVSSFSIFSNTGANFPAGAIQLVIGIVIPIQ